MADVLSGFHDVFSKLLRLYLRFYSNFINTLVQCIMTNDAYCEFLKPLKFFKADDLYLKYDTVFHFAMLLSTHPSKLSELCHQRFILYDTNKI